MVGWEGGGGGEGMGGGGGGEGGGGGGGDVSRSHTLVLGSGSGVLVGVLPETVCNRGVLLHIHRKIQKVLVFTAYLREGAEHQP